VLATVDAGSKVGCIPNPYTVIWGGHMCNFVYTGHSAETQPATQKQSIGRPCDLAEVGIHGASSSLLMPWPPWLPSRRGDGDRECADCGGADCGGAGCLGPGWGGSNCGGACSWRWGVLVLVVGAGSEASWISQDCLTGRMREHNSILKELLNQAKHGMNPGRNKTRT
jgi:hypothetical protein